MVPQKIVRAVKKACDGKPNVEIYDYLGADHGFNRFGYPPFHQQSAERALERSLGPKTASGREVALLAAGAEKATAERVAPRLPSACAQCDTATLLTPAERTLFTSRPRSGSPSVVSSNM